MMAWLVVAFLTCADFALSVALSVSCARRGQLSIMLSVLAKCTAMLIYLCERDPTLSALSLSLLCITIMTQTVLLLTIDQQRGAAHLLAFFCAMAALTPFAAQTEVLSDGAALIVCAAAARVAMQRLQCDRFSAMVCALCFAYALTLVMHYALYFPSYDTAHAKIGRIMYTAYISHALWTLARGSNERA